ncbi:MAG: class 1 isoprenoid biosynthesis enzyme, partial [Syntrophales bacterium]
MEGRIADLLSFCSLVNFGAVNLSREEEAFRGELNREMLSLCEYLPESMRTGAALFLVKYLCTSFVGGLNFVNYFYTPAWSILFWLHRSCPDNRKLDPKYVKDAKTGHTMTMFLHALDDHLTDGQLPVTHLALLMRTQSWMIMNEAFERLARGVEDGPAIVRDFIDDYYSSIGKSDEMESLDSYCAFFTKQMATWLIVPVLMAKGIYANEEFARSVQAVYSSFGIAWRLLDDLQDIEKDMMRGVHSSIYVCLNKDVRGWWDKDPEKKKNQNKKYVQTILRYVLEKNVIDSIKDRACSELESAASIADSCSMAGFADEL